MYEYKAEVLEVKDGDTLVCLVDLGMYTYRQCTIRVLGLDTPEKFAKGGDAQEKELGLICKAYAEKMLLGKKMTVRTQKGEGNKLFDSFGRVLADVIVDGVNWTEHLTSLGANKYLENYSPEKIYALKEKEGF